VRVEPSQVMNTSMFMPNLMLEVVRVRSCGVQGRFFQANETRSGTRSPGQFNYQCSRTEAKAAQQRLHSRT
jgi:hypothetical protein